MKTLMTEIFGSSSYFFFLWYCIDFFLFGRYCSFHSFIPSFLLTLLLSALLPIQHPFFLTQGDNPTSNLLAKVADVTLLWQGWYVLYWIVIILYRCWNKLQPTTIIQTVAIQSSLNETDSQSNTNSVQSSQNHINTNQWEIISREKNIIHQLKN